MHTPINKLIVRLEKKLYDSRTFESGQTIHFDPSWHPEEHAMLKATVISVPPGVINRPDYDGYAICVKECEEILIRYDVVFAYNDQPDRDSPVYKNLIFEYNEVTGRYEEYWLCDILQVLAVVRGDVYEMVNGFVKLGVIQERKEGYTSNIIRPDSYNNLELKHKAMVLAGGAGMGLEPGEVVYINGQAVMQYQLNLDKFYIIKEKYILAKETPETYTSFLADLTEAL